MAKMSRFTVHSEEMCPSTLQRLQIAGGLSGQSEVRQHIVHEFVFVRTERTGSTMSSLLADAASASELTLNTWIGAVRLRQRWVRVSLCLLLMSNITLLALLCPTSPQL